MNLYIATLVASAPRGYNASDLAVAAALLETTKVTAPNSTTYPVALASIRREQAMRRHPSFKGQHSYINY